MGNHFGLASASPAGGQIKMKSVIESSRKSSLNYITETTKGHPLAPKLLEGVLTCRSMDEWNQNIELVNIGIVEGCFLISTKKHFRFYLPTIEAKIVVKLNLDPSSERMRFDFQCGGSKNPAGTGRVKDPWATRQNTADGSVGDHFDEYHDLHLMGLTYKRDERESVMMILWQFNGAAQEDVKESMHLSISGGRRDDYVFEKNQSINYPIWGMQKRFVLKGASKPGEDVRNLEAIHVNATEIEGDILEAQYDENSRAWKYKLLADLDMDGERAFAGTMGFMEKETIITIGGVSIKLEPKGRPSKI